MRWDSSSLIFSYLHSFQVVGLRRAVLGLGTITNATIPNNFTKLFSSVVFTPPFSDLEMEKFSHIHCDGKASVDRLLEAMNKAKNTTDGLASCLSPSEWSTAYDVLSKWYGLQQAKGGIHSVFKLLDSSLMESDGEKKFQELITILKDSGKEYQPPIKYEVASALMLQVTLPLTVKKKPFVSNESLKKNWISWIQNSAARSIQKAYRKYKHRKLSVKTDQQWKNAQTHASSVILRALAVTGLFEARRTYQSKAQQVM
jgi:hypothetical protein